MSDLNFVEQAGAFAADAGIDTAAEGVINKVTLLLPIFLGVKLCPVY